MNRDFSLLDASIIRAKEGLRILEEFCRFVLKNAEYFVILKQIRHQLDELTQQLGRAQLIYARRGPDLGQVEVHNSEYLRQGALDIVQANCRRVAESLRVLEEFAKLYQPKISYELENYRYRVYELELKICAKLPQFWLNKYFEEGVIYAISDEVEEIIWLAEHGAKIVQLRDKKSTRQEIYHKTKYLCDYLKNIKHQGEPVLFILNDDVEIASRLPVAGVHLGQVDGIIENARWQLGSLKIIGHSNHSLEQLEKSAAEGWDYLSIGPVFATPTKEGRPAVGIEIIGETAKKINKPWLAVGGVKKSNIEQLKKIGAKNFAVVRSAKEFFS